MKSYIHILNKVWNIREQGLINAHEQDLLLYLIHRCNRLGWINPFPQSSKIICAVLGINRNALIRRRDRLEELGLISIETMKDKSKATCYRLHIELHTHKNEISERKENIKTCRPTVSDIAMYCSKRNNTISAESFFNYYESKGWMVGNHPMKDWKAAVRTWELNSKKHLPTTINHASAHHSNEKEYGQF